LHPLFQAPDATAPSTASPAAIKSGDIVAGADGVPMNVRSINDGRLLCTWMTERGTRQVQFFDLGTVRLLYALSHLNERGRPHGEEQREWRTRADARLHVDPDAQSSATWDLTAAGERSGSGSQSLWQYLPHK
jgi:hypothetical protein